MTRFLFLGALCALGFAARPTWAQEPTKIGYIDMARALNETEDGRKAKASLKKIFDVKQKELDEQQEKLKKAAEDLDKKRTLLPAEQVRAKEAELQQEMQKVTNTYMRHQKDLQEKEAAETGKIVERMQRIVFKIATAENFTMVLDRNQSGVVFAKPHLDLTNEVIRRYNSGEGSDGGKASAAPKPAAPAKAPTPPAKK